MTTWLQLLFVIALPAAVGFLVVLAWMTRTDA